jgi:hypothetical protein
MSTSKQEIEPMPVIATAMAVGSPYATAENQPCFEVVAPATLPEVSTRLNKYIARLHS